MKIQRVIKPEMAIVLMPWFVPVDQSREEILVILADKLKNDFENTLVLIAVDNDKVRLFTAVFKDTDSSTYLWQARSSVGFRGSMDILKLIEQWARDKKCSELTAGTAIKGRRLQAIMRKYNFRHCGGKLIKEIK